MARTLPELRTLIDAVDLELLQLLNQRAGYAHEVGEIKRLEGQIKDIANLQGEIAALRSAAVRRFVDPGVRVERAGEFVEIPIELVRVGNVLQGQKTTLPVTMEHMIYHTECVARGSSRPLIVADMPSTLIVWPLVNATFVCAVATPFFRIE